MKNSFLCGALVLAISSAVLIAHAADSPANAPNTNTVEILIATTSGDILVEGGEVFGGSWSNLMCIDPKGDTITLLGTSWQLLLKPANNPWQCPFPIVPRGDFLLAQFDEGSSVLVRLPFGTAEKLGESKARFGGKDYEFQQVPQLDVARYLLEGKEVSLDFDEKAVPMIDTWIAQADCRSIVAFHEKTGQREALERAAWVLSRILVSFKSRYGRFPQTPCQLYTGEKAILSNLPLNPFEIDRNLCESILSQPRPKGYVKYIPEIESKPDGSEKVVGFWLAVVCDGATKEPIKPLSEGKEPPIRAVMRFEVHETD